MEDVKIYFNQKEEYTIDKYAERGYTSNCLEVLIK